MMKKQQAMSQMKRQDKNPRKTTKWSGDRQTSRKKNSDDDCEDDPGSQEKNGGKHWEDVRNVYQRPKRTKEQTCRSESYTIDSF